MLLLDRLKTIAIVKKNKAVSLLKNDTIIAIRETTTGSNMRIFACSFSVLVNGAFCIVFDFITYLRIAHKDSPISIMFIPKNTIENWISLYCPSRCDENGTSPTNSKKIALRLDNLISTFLANTEAI